jgi:hypothetical protein
MSFSSNRQQPSDGGAVGSALLIALYVFEASAVAAVLAINRYYNVLETLTVRQLAMVAAPVVLALASGAYVAVGLLRAFASHRRAVTFAIALNVIAVLLICVGSEIAVRALSVSQLTGTWFGSTLLLPKDWADVKARHREILALVRDDLSYFVVDDLLGWAPGRGRRSSDGRYATSIEGFRSATSGVSYASRPASPRIAIVGDSFTFGLEVPFETSWGAVLERSLGENATVLNLGVDGYGVDQAVLRYERDARSWRPAVSILGFIEHDLLRSTSVYSFVTFPEWGFPFSKPHFVVKNGTLTLLTQRLQKPTQILDTESIADLPFITDDPGYDPEEWEHHSYDASYAVRFIRSRFRRWPAPKAETNGSIVELNRELVLRFVRVAQSDGSVPLVVFFPARTDLDGEARPDRDAMLTALQDAGVKYVDLRACIGSFGIDKAFIPEHYHYSAEGNAAVAQCLLPHVRDGIARAQANLPVTADR